MRFYTGNQWQDNALGALGSLNPTVINTGTYCTVNANPGYPAVVFGVTPQPYSLPFAFVSAGFYIYGNIGVTGGTIQPQIMLADLIFRDYGPLVTVTAAGFIYATTVNSPIYGAQFNVTGAMTGGSVFLSIDCLFG